MTNLLVSEVVRSENQFGHSYRVTTPSSSVYVQRTFGISSTEPKVQGFPKNRPFLIINIPNLLSDDKEGKIKFDIDFSFFINRASFMRNPVVL